MLSAQLIGLVALGTMLAPDAAGPSFDECLRGIRSAPDSFVPYFCLGTPGLPERAPEVRSTLENVLRRKPHEPHARLYLALMDSYAAKKPDTAEFREPLAAFERRGVALDIYFGRLGLLERLCLYSVNDCKDARPLLDSARGLA